MRTSDWSSDVCSSDLGVMAHRLFSRAYRLPPLIHHEDGFNEDESVRRNWKRNAFRRLALPAAEALVVPSALLERIARGEWGARDHVAMIRNGIDTAASEAPPLVAIQIGRASCRERVCTYV